MEYSVMKLDDLLSDLIGNVSQSQLDEELSNFRFYARKLGVRNYNDLWVAISEEDPSFVLQDELALPSPSKGREVYLYPSAKVLVEKFNGEIYIYAVSEESLISLLDTMEHFSDMPVEDFYTSEDVQDLEEMEKNKSFINIEECLKLRDKVSNNKYDLQNKYLSERYTFEEKSHIASMLKESASDEEIYNYMKELYNDEDALNSFYSEEENTPDPYKIAKEDILRDIENDTVKHMEDEETILKNMMELYGWDELKAKEYIDAYWSAYENYMRDNSQVDDEYDWEF